MGSGRQWLFNGAWRYNGLDKTVFDDVGLYSGWDRDTEHGFGLRSSVYSVGA